MPKLNENYLNLKQSYLFSEIAHRVAAYQESNPDKKIIRLGIGDVTLPIGSNVIEAMHEGVDAQAKSETFKGYGPEQGYDFVRNAIVNYYATNGVSIDAGEIFISDGAKILIGGPQYPAPLVIYNLLPFTSYIPARKSLADSTI